MKSSRRRRVDGRLPRQPLRGLDRVGGDLVDHSAEEFAWIVDSDPSLPWVIAFSMVTTSSPNTSPTMTREGFIRSVSRTSSAIVTAPADSALANRSSNAIAFSRMRPRCPHPNPARGTARPSRCVPQARSQPQGPATAWLLPALVPPATITFFRALTAAATKSANSSSRVSKAIRSFKLPGRGGAYGSRPPVGARPTGPHTTATRRAAEG